MGVEIVAVSVGGMEYRGWRSMSVRYGARSPERSFQVVGAIGDEGPAAAAFAINLNDPCVLTSNGDVLVVGRITEIEIDLEAEEHAIKLTGKSRGADAVKSSVDHPTHEWKNKDALDVAKSIDTSGIGYKTDEKLRKFDKIRCNVGDTQMKALQKIIGKDGLWLTGTEDGGIIITKHGKHRHAGGLIEGENAMKVKATFSSEDRMEKVKVKSHVPKGADTKEWRSKGEATDSGGRPGTVKVIVPKASMKPDEAKAHAENVADNRHGDSVKCSCQTQGFRDLGGRIWQPGWLVWCEVPSARLAHDLCVDTIELTQDQEPQGSVAHLTLVKPEALGGKGGKSGSKSAKAPSYKGWKAR
ncbi:MAG: phage baseplate assembly protein [Hyphomicrobiaceae bacterium]